MATQPGLSILCQSERGGREERLVRQLAMIEDIPLHTASLNDVERCAKALGGGELLPVGSVEFVREAMALARIAEPANLSYPSALRPHLHRRLEQRAAGTVLGRWFVKPVATKAFTGFVFDSLQSPENLPEHDRAQCEAFLALAPETLVWVAEPVRWESEVRYYILEGKILGEGRYDDGPDDAPLPDIATVRKMVMRFGESSLAPLAYALDVGVLEGGGSALVEVNDAWALGYYSGTLKPALYLEMLWRRWQELVSGRS